MPPSEFYPPSRTCWGFSRVFCDSQEIALLLDRRCLTSRPTSAHKVSIHAGRPWDQGNFAQTFLINKTNKKGQKNGFDVDAHHAAHFTEQYDRIFQLTSTVSPTKSSINLRIDTRSQLQAVCYTPVRIFGDYFARCVLFARNIPIDSSRHNK